VTQPLRPEHFPLSKFLLNKHNLSGIGPISFFGWAVYEEIPNQLAPSHAVVEYLYLGERQGRKFIHFLPIYKGK
jgi:hypothetical protein